MLTKPILNRIKKLFQQWAPGWSIKIEDLSEERPVVRVKLMLYDEATNIRKDLGISFGEYEIDLLLAGRTAWYDNEETKCWLEFDTYFKYHKDLFEESIKAKTEDETNE